MTDLRTDGQVHGAHHSGAVGSGTHLAARRDVLDGALDPGEEESTDANWLQPATAPERTSRRGATPVERSRRRTVRRLAAFGVILLGAVGFLLFKGIGTSLNYWVSIHQALAERSSLAGKTFRLRGIVVAGSVHSHGSLVDFTIEQGAQRIAVENHGSPPQLFQVGIPVIVQGHFDGPTFVSHQVIVDHTGNYAPQTTKTAQAKTTSRTTAPTTKAAQTKTTSTTSAPTTQKAQVAEASTSRTVSQTTSQTAQTTSTAAAATTKG